MVLVLSMASASLVGHAFGNTPLKSSSLHLLTDHEPASRVLFHQRRGAGQREGRWNCARADGRRNTRRRKCRLQGCGPLRITSAVVVSLWVLTIAYNVLVETYVVEAIISCAKVWLLAREEVKLEFILSIWVSG